jgi:hypothetical protein
MAPALEHRRRNKMTKSFAQCRASDAEALPEVVEATYIIEDGLS